MRTAIIDGDILVYSAGFASDQRMYTTPDGLSKYKYKKDAEGYCIRNRLKVDDITKEITPEPVEFCLNSLKKMVESIVKATESDQYHIYLTGEVTGIRPGLNASYKANRDSAAKPTWYKEMREYLVNHHAAVITVDGWEADDWMAVKASIPDTTVRVMCSLDKDLLTVPGYHYNWRTDTFKYVAPVEADRNFRRQLLMGDRADNIQGLALIGPKRAEAILRDTDGHPPEVQYKVILDLYRKQHKEDGDAIFVETGNLLYIRRQRDETGHISDVLWWPPIPNFMVDSESQKITERTLDKCRRLIEVGKEPVLEDILEADLEKKSTDPDTKKMWEDFLKYGESHLITKLTGGISTSESLGASAGTAEASTSIATVYTLPTSISGPPGLPLSAKAILHPKTELKSSTS